MNKPMHYVSQYNYNVVNNTLQICNTPFLSVSYCKVLLYNFSEMKVFIEEYNIKVNKPAMISPLEYLIIIV